MDIESIQTKFKSFHEILNPPLVRFLKRIYQGRNGEDIINLKSLDINKFKRRLLEKVKKHKDFVWSENGTRGGVAFDECLKILEDSWYKIANDRNLEEWDRKEREGYISQTQTLRNKYCHPIEGLNPSEEDLLLCAETFYKFGTSIDMSHAELEEIYSIKKILAKEVYSLTELDTDMESITKAREKPIDIVKSERKGAKDNFRFQGKGYSVEIKTIFHNPEDTRVLSVNAQVTFELIQDYKIHSCPNKGDHYDYKPTQYITFRDSGGAMDSIFKIEQILIVHDFEKVLKDPKNNFFKLIQSALEGKKHPLENKDLKRLKKYCNSEIFKTFLFFYKNNRYYILSEDVEHLPEKKVFLERRVPRTSGSGEKKEELVPLYYDLSDFK